MTKYAIRQATTAVTNAILKRYGHDRSIGPSPARQAAAVGKIPSQLTTVIFHFDGDPDPVANSGENQTSSPVTVR